MPTSRLSPQNKMTGHPAESDVHERAFVRARSDVTAASVSQLGALNIYAQLGDGPAVQPRPN